MSDWRQVEIPGRGIVEFPASMSDDEIASAIKRNLESTHTGEGEAAIKRGQEARGSFKEGFKASGRDTWMGIKQLTNNATQEEVDANAARTADALKGGYGKFGYLTGATAQQLPFQAVPGVNSVLGAAALGGVMGGIQPVPTGGDRALNTVLGAAGGAGGQLLGKGIGKVLGGAASPYSPETKALIGTLKQNGVPLTAAQESGNRTLQMIDAVLANLPATGTKAAEMTAAQRAAWNRAVARQFGADSDAITPEVLGDAKREIGTRFTDLASRNSVGQQQTLTLTNELANIESKYLSTGTKQTKSAVTDLVDDILKKVDPQTQTIPGTAYRQMDSRLGQVARGSADGDTRYAAGELRDALRNAMDGSIRPEDVAAWAKARREYGNLQTVAKAPTDQSGNVSPASLWNTVKSANRTNRFSGGGDLGDLARAGALLKSPVGDSGTAQRLMYQSAITGGLGAGAALSGDSPDMENLLIGGGVGLLSPKLLQMALTNPATRQVVLKGLLGERSQVFAPALTAGGAALGTNSLLSSR